MNAALKWTGAIGAVLIFSILFPAASAHARGIATVDFAKGNVNIASIAIVPPQAEMTTRKVGADDAMIAESRQLEVYGLENTVRLLQDKGYAVKTISQEELAEDSILQDLVRQANDRFSEEYAKLALKPGLLKKGRYNIGAEAQQLADYLDVDAVVFERIYMEAAAAGQMAIALLIGGSSGGAKFDVTMVNGQDGSVLGYYNSFLGVIGKESATTRSEGMVMQMATKALKKFPVRSGEAAVAADDSDDADLDALESLLGMDGDDESTEFETLPDEDNADLEELEQLPEVEIDENPQ